MRIFLAAVATMAAFSANADSALHVSHLQHFYAGGGGCAERFWLYWDNTELEITDIELLVAVTSKGQRGMEETLHLERLGFTTSDNKDEVSFETPQCLSGNPRLTIRAASAIIRGTRVDLLDRKMLRIDKVETFPFRISDPTHPSTGPARKAAQAGEVKR